MLDILFEICDYKNKKVGNDYAEKKPCDIIQRSDFMKKVAYYSIIAIFNITAITYVLGVVYISGEYFLGMRFLPDTIWNSLDFYFYKEAGPLRLAMTVVIFIFLSILLIAFYRRDISKATIILHTLIPIMTILWWISAYLFSSLFADGVVVGMCSTLMSIVCIANTITTAILIVRDRNKIKIEQ